MTKFEAKMENRCRLPQSTYIKTSRGYIGKNSLKLLKSRRSEHGDSCVSEIRYSFEQRRGSQVSADMQYATVFINTPHAFMDLSAYYGKLLGIGQRIQGAPIEARPTITPSTPYLVNASSAA